MTAVVSLPEAEFSPVVGDALLGGAGNSAGSSSFYELEAQVLEHVAKRAQDLATRTLGVNAASISISGSTKSPVLIATLTISTNTSPELVMARLTNGFIPDLEAVLGAKFVSESIQFEIDRSAESLSVDAEPLLHVEPTISAVASTPLDTRDLATA